MTENWFPITNDEKAENNRVRAEFTVTEDMIWLDGHFPERALLPGIAQLYFISELLKKYFHIEAEYTGLSKIKFKAPVFPGDRVEILIEPKGENRFSFEMICGETIVSSGYFNTSDVKPTL